MNILCKHCETLVNLFDSNIMQAISANNKVPPDPATYCSFYSSYLYIYEIHENDLPSWWSKWPRVPRSSKAAKQMLNTLRFRSLGRQAGVGAHFAIDTGCYGKQKFDNE